MIKQSNFLYKDNCQDDKLIVCQEKAISLEKKQKVTTIKMPNCYNLIGDWFTK